MKTAIGLIMILVFSLSCTKKMDIYYLSSLCGALNSCLSEVLDNKPIDWRLSGDEDQQYCFIKFKERKIGDSLYELDDRYYAFPKTGEFEVLTLCESIKNDLNWSKK